MKILRFGIILLLSVTLWGCGKGNSAAPITVDPSTGKHPAGTAVASTGGAHVDAYFASPSGCEGCHGKTGDLAGGIVKVSCSTNTRSGMTCHPGKFPHGVGFGNPVLHGEKVRNAPIGTNGIAFCKKCHGSNYQGVPGSGVSCIACHKLTTPASNAPHAGDWLNGTFKHSATNEANAPACGECHLGGKKLAIPVSLPAGTPAPTCFGATALCHFEAGHANPYIAKTDHGLAARANLGRCIPCHATFPVGSTVPDFSRVRGTTNLSPNGCQKCHTQAGLAHPYGWLPGRGTTVGQAGNNTTNHSTASFGTSGSYCSPCHALTGTAALPNSVAPSCMTQTAQVGGTTFCHFTASPVANISGCISCHANSPSGPNGAEGPTGPNRNRKHFVHFNSIPGLVGCNGCHNGFGSPRTDHSNGTVNTAINGIFSEGVAVHTPGVGCSNVSCHGGIATPPWNATPNVNYVYDPTGVNCTLNCHGAVLNNVSNVPGSNYIGVYNGDPNPGLYYDISPSLNQHDFHVNNFPATVCTDCHGLQADKLPLNHFNGLSNGKRAFVVSDPKAAGYAAGTIGGAGTQIIGAYTYDAVSPGIIPRGSCVATCHSFEPRFWFLK